jgi:hypothetical protein
VYFGGEAMRSELVCDVNIKLNVCVVIGLDGESSWVELDDMDDVEGVREQLMAQLRGLA